MILLYWLFNFWITSFLLSAALAGIFYYNPLIKKLIQADLINDGEKIIALSQKRIFFCLAAYAIFIATSCFLFGIGPLVSTAANIFLVVLIDWNKIFGKHPAVKNSFLNINEKFFKDKAKVVNIILRA